MISILLSTRLGERRWSQADLSRKTGIRPNTINVLYNGLTDRISLKQLDQICETLDCDICDILTRNVKQIKQVEKANLFSKHVLPESKAIRLFDEELKKQKQLVYS